MRVAFLFFLLCLFLAGCALLAGWNGNTVGMLINTHLLALNLGLMIMAIARPRRH